MPGGSGSLVERGLQNALDQACAAHPGKRLTPWFQDEARFGQKGRTCRRWFIRGQRPSGLCDQRHAWTHLFAAVRPATGQSFALVLPAVSTAAMQVLPPCKCSWTGSPERSTLTSAPCWSWTRPVGTSPKHWSVPDNMTLALLPPYSPELNPVERVWPYLRERHLSHRVLASCDAIVDAVCHAWNQLTPQRIHTLTSSPYLDQVSF